MIDTTIKKYDLEERTFQFAADVRTFVSMLSKTIVNIEDGRQLIRSSGSIGANYIEANEKLGVKDFLLRLKIARKEAKESIYWLKLLKHTNKIEQEKIDLLIDECDQLKRILSTIIIKSTNGK